MTDAIDEKSLLTAIERLKKRVGLVNEDLASLSRRERALQARYRAILTRTVSIAIPSLRRAVLDKLAVQYPQFVDEDILALFGVRHRLLRAIGTHSSDSDLQDLRDRFSRYLSNTYCAPLDPIRAELSSVSSLLSHEKRLQGEISNVLSGLVSALTNSVPLPREISEDLQRLGQRYPRAMAGVMPPDQADKMHPPSFDTIPDADSFGVTPAVRIFALAQLNQSSVRERLDKLKPNATRQDESAST